MLKLTYFLFAVIISSSWQLRADENETPPTTTPQTFVSFTGAVTGSKVRLRTQPALEGHVVRETTNGELFAVVREENDFYAVVPPKGTKGYIFRTFVLDGKVEGDRVNVRLYPDIEAPVVARLNSGDRVDAVVSDVNNRWLEINLPETSCFYIAKEYLDNKGPVDLIAKLEARHSQATHHLSSAFLFAQAEIQKPFEQIDLDLVNQKFNEISQEYQDLSGIVEQAHEAASVIQEIYVQKKIAFLESKAQKKAVAYQIDANHLDRLSKLGIEIQPASAELHVADVAETTTSTIGIASTLSDREITDKMLVWQPLEESIYHLWAADNPDIGIDAFYAEEKIQANCLTGMIEPYTRPVKNRPGDFILKSDNVPVAFLYSTRVNLQKLVGKQVTLIASPRPNHNFAFPAYFVLEIE